MPRPKRIGPCSVEGCETQMVSRGMCKYHYDRDRQARLPRCSVEDCNNAARVGTGICGPCTQRLRRTGSLDRRRKAHRIDRQGYVAVWAPGHPMATAQGWVLEHRKVAYDAGLLMDPDDHVHHVNHVKDDNRLENLEVLSPEDHLEIHAAERRLDWERARHLYEVEGWPTTAVARELGTFAGNVSRRLRAMGVQMRPSGEGRAKHYAGERAKPGWFRGKTRVAHFAPHGAVSRGWETACGRTITRPGMVSAREWRRCERCEIALSDDGGPNWQRRPA